MLARLPFYNFGDDMKRIDPSIVGGLLLILTGGLFLLQKMGILDNVGDVFWGAKFLAAGALFLFMFFTGSWWAVIPGCVLAGIGALILLPDSLEVYGGALFRLERSREIFRAVKHVLHSGIKILAVEKHQFNA